MKKLYASIVLAFLGTILASGQTNHIVRISAPPVTGFEERYAAFTRACRVDSTSCIITGYLVGNTTDDPAFARKTTDRGQTWRDVIVKPRQGDRNWDATHPEIHWRRFYDISCPNDSLCVIVGDSSRMHRSTDGGETWVDSKLNAGNDSDLISVRMWNKEIGILSASNRLFVTPDGGITWSQATAPLPDTLPVLDYGYYYFIIAAPASGSVVIGWDALARDVPGGSLRKYTRFYRTDDTARTWHEVGSPGYDRWTFNKFFTSPSVGWSANAGEAIGGGGHKRNQILKSADSGLSWQLVANVYTGTEFGLNSIAFGDPATGIAVGSNGAMMSVDSGTTWKSMSFDDSEKIVNFQDVCFLSPTVAIFPANGRIFMWNASLSAVPVDHDLARKVLVQPSVTSNSTFVTFDLDQQKTVHVVVSSSYGDVVRRLTQRTYEPGHNMQEIDCTSLPAGAYLVRIDLGYTSSFGTFIVVH